MKRNGWKKLLATAGVMSLTVGCLSGCGGEPQGNPQTGSTQPGSQAQEQSQEQSQEAPGSAKVTFPLAEQVELTIATPDGAVASLADNLPIWEEIQKRTNIKINWDVTASKQYGAKVNSRLTPSISTVILSPALSPMFFSVKRVA